MPHITPQQLDRLRFTACDKEHAGAVVMLEDLRALIADHAALHVLVTMISKQRPEKPDYWTPCGQCEHNIDDAKEATGTT